MDVFLKKSLLDQIVLLMSSFPSVQRVILFGSRARGDAEERSDIDLAIAAPYADIKEWLTINEQLEQIDTLLPIDCIRYEIAPAGLRNRIDKEGIVLYERI